MLIWRSRSRSISTAPLGRMDEAVEMLRLRCATLSMTTVFRYLGAYNKLRACKSAITSNIITPLIWVEPSTGPPGWVVQLVLKR